MKDISSKTNLIQNLFRILLALFMIYAGVGHLSFARSEFHAQVPTWLTTNNSFIDFIIISSGIVEIILGILMLTGGKIKIGAGILLALFYVLIFPGNINQYVNEINAFGLDTDTKRLIRLFFQPILIFLALWSTGALNYIKQKIIIK